MTITLTTSGKFMADTKHNGYRDRTVLETKKEALEHEMETRLRMAKETYSPSAAGAGRGMTLQEAFELVENEDWKGLSTEAYRVRLAVHHILPQLGADTVVTDVTPQMIQDKLAGPWRDSGLAWTTQINRRACFRAILTKARDKGALAKLPSWPRPKRKILNGKLEGQRVRYLTEEEEDRIFIHLQPEMRRLATFLLETGMRIGEALAARWKDIDLWHGGVIEIPCSKTGQPRKVPLTKRAQEALPPILDGDKGDALIFTFDVRRFQEAWRRARKAADLDEREIVPHTLRHTYATRMAMRAMPINTLARMLGHANISMTERYLHHYPEQMDIARKFMEGK